MKRIISIIFISCIAVVCISCGKKSINNVDSKTKDELDKCIKISLTQAYGKEVANEYVMDSCRYYESEGSFTVGGSQGWNCIYHTPSEKNILIDVPYTDDIKYYNMFFRISDSNGKMRIDYRTGDLAVGNVLRYSNYENSIIGISNDLIETTYDDLEVLDKIKYGTIGNTDMLWTVCEKNGGKVMICSDYAFNIPEGCYGVGDNESIEALYGGLGFDLIFDNKEKEHIIRNVGNEGYGYYYFSLPTYIYNNVLSDYSSKRVLGTIDLKFFGSSGPNYFDISKCRSYDVGVFPTSSNLYDIDGVYSKYSRFHMDDLYGESAMAFKKHRSEDNIPVRLCMYLDCNTFSKIANYEEHKKLDCIKICYSVEKRIQNLDDEYVEELTFFDKNYHPFERDSNLICNKYKDKSKIYDYNTFIKDIYYLLSDNNMSIITFLRIFNDTKIQFLGKSVDRSNTFKRKQLYNYYKYDVNCSLPNDFYTIIGKSISDGLHYINYDYKGRKYAIGNNEIYLYQNIEKEGQIEHFNDKKALGNREVIFCVDYTNENVGNITFRELEKANNVEEEATISQSVIDENINETIEDIDIKKLMNKKVVESRDLSELNIDKIKKLISKTNIGTIFYWGISGNSQAWQLIKKENGKALFVTISPFYSPEIPQENKELQFTYETSSFRKFLNNDFINKYLINNLQNFILETKVKNLEPNEFGISLGKDTVDKVFILSIAEEKDAESIIKSDKIAKIYRKFKKDEKYKYRDAGDSNDKLAIWTPDDTGYIKREGESFYYTYPARLGMWISFE